MEEVCQAGLRSSVDLLWPSGDPLKDMYSISLVQLFEEALSVASCL